MSYKTIGKDFFERHQSKLLWLLNKPLVGKWFRRVLCINGSKSAIGSREIVKIVPNAIFWDTSPGQQTAEFRTNDKFALRIYYAFLPVWLALGYSHCYKALSKDFFRSNQELLIWLLNNKYTKQWFRWVLRIQGDRSQVGKKDILNILPHAIFWKGETEEYVGEFRTHAKFSKRLYYAFRPLWWMCHFWDSLIADRWIPKYSFGFASITVKPDADPETNTVDGTIYATIAEDTWATIRTGAGTLAEDDTGTMQLAYYVAGPTTNMWVTTGRGVALFDTSQITRKAGVSSAIAYIYIPVGGIADPSSNTPGVVATGPVLVQSDTSLDILDYAAVLAAPAAASTSSFASWSESAYGNITLNTGVISREGITKLGFTSDNDFFEDFDPIWGADELTKISGRSSDSAGTAEDPYMVVNFAYFLRGSSLVIYPDPDPDNITTMSAVAVKFLGIGVGETWANIRTGNADSVSQENALISNLQGDSGLGTGFWRRLSRTFLLFDTSSLPTSSTITTGTLSIYGNDKFDGGGFSPDVNIYDATPASNTNILTTDFTNIGSTAQCDTTITYANWTISDYNDFVLNSTGISNIDKSGVSKFGARNATNDAANVEPTWSTGFSYLRCYLTNGVGLSNDPKLVVNYSISSPFGGARQFGEN